MTFRRMMVMGTLASCFLLANETAYADLSQFAQFTQVASDQPLSFTNNGGTSGSLAYNAASLVNFSFTTSSGLDTTVRTATLTLTGNPTNVPASTLGGGFLDQPLTSVMMLKLTEVGGATPGANLLTVMFTGDIVGRGPIGSINAADTTGQVISYTSDFLTVTPPGNSDILSLDTISPSLSIGPGGFLNSFVANVAGQFTGNVTSINPSALVPEPSSLAMCGIAGVVGLAVARARRKRFA